MALRRVRLPLALRVTVAFTLVGLGSGLLVFAAMATVASPEMERKAAAIVLAAAAVWLLSKGGIRLYDMLLER